MPSESAILRNCSSFVRKSANRDVIELAHFTVEEFFRKIPVENHSYSAYRIEGDIHDLNLAQCCLTFLNLADFRLPSPDLKSHRARAKDHPFWEHAVLYWTSYAEPHFDDSSILNLARSLFTPSGPTNLISWARSFAFSILDEGDEDEAIYIEIQTAANRFTPGNATPLHYAAMVRYPALAMCLLAKDIDVNQITSIGTPIHCCIIGLDTGYYLGPYVPFYSSKVTVGMTEASLSLGRMLIDAGADCSIRCQNASGVYHSVVHLALRMLLYHTQSKDGMKLIISLLPHLLGAGAVIDDRVVGQLEEFQDFDGFQETFAALVSYFRQSNVHGSAVARLLELGKGVSPPAATNLLQLGDIESMDATQRSAQLRFAAQFNNVDMLGALFRTQDIKINAQDLSTGDTALHLAVASSCLEAAKALLAAGASIDAVNKEGKSPLHLCAASGNKVVFQHLLQGGANVQITDKAGSTVWHVAAESNSEGVIDILLSDLESSHSALAQEDLMGRTPIFRAAIAGSEDALGLLSQHVPNVNSRSSKGLTLAHVCQNISLGTLNHLHALGLDWAITSNDGSTALHGCVSHVQDSGQMWEVIDLLGFLTEKGVDPNRRRNNGDTALHILLETSLTCHDSLKAVEHLATASTINVLNSEGQAPIHLLLRRAARGNFAVQALNNLIKCGADIMQHDSLGRSPLEVFLDSRKTGVFYDEKDADLLCAFLQHAPDSISAPNTDIGPRTLIWACHAGSDSAVESLIKLGVDIRTSVASLGQKSALEAVCEGEYGHKVFRMVMDKADKEDLMRRNKMSGQTLLHRICSTASGNPVTHLRYLLDRGVEVNALSSQSGQTSLMYAAKAGKVEHVRLLLEQGASVTLVDDDG